MSGEQVTNSEFHQVHPTIKKTSRKSKKVDINILLNKIRATRKKEKLKNTIFFGLTTAAIVVTAIIFSL
tara:strand:+ start:400 stop:606 length:207 start_codon:yes stop_codon:yes gene_type:complete